MYYNGFKVLWVCSKGMTNYIFETEHNYSFPIDIDLTPYDIADSPQLFSEFSGNHEYLILNGYDISQLLFINDDSKIMYIADYEDILIERHRILDGEYE